MKRRVLLAVLAAIVVVVLAGPGGSASAPMGRIGGAPGQTWTGSPGTTVSVASLMARQRAEGRRGSGQSERTRERPEPRPTQPKRPSSTSVRTRTGAAAVAPKSELSAGTSFLGAHRLADSTFVPPDSMGSVGPTQVLVVVNGRVRVFNKDGSNPGVLDVSDSTFWGSTANGLDVTDPGVEYDRLSQRWIISQVNFDASDPTMTDNRIMIAISSGPTITSSSSFTKFFFTAGTGRFADYPQLGVDANAVYIGTNDFGSTGSFLGTSAFVVNKADLLADTLTVTAFHNLITSGVGPDSPQPAQDMDPNVSAGYIVGPDNLSFGQLDVVRINDPGGATPTKTSFTVTVPATDFPENVPAQGSPHKLDALDDRLFEAMIGTNPSGTPSLWTAHNIEVNSSGVASASGGRDGARWYQLGNLSTTPTLTQSGTLFDPASSNPRFFWIPSIAMNGQGHASLNASTAGTGLFAEVASSAHLASDPAGTTEPFDITQTSSSTYNLGVNPDRWGDYSQTVVDPTDNMTFWTFQEFTNATNDWGVRVIQLNAPPPATPTTASPNTIPIGQSSVSVTISGTSLKGSGFFDPGPDTGGPGFPNHIDASVTGGVTLNPTGPNGNGVTFTDPTHVTLDLNTTGASSPGNSQDVTITNPDGQLLTGQNILVVGSDTTPPAPPILGGTTPASPANNNFPLVFGSAEGGSTVRLYINSSCSGAPATTGTAASFASPGLGVSVPDNSTTTFFGTATDVSNNTSPCSSTLPAGGSVTYREDSTLPGPPETTITKGPKKTRKTRPKFKFTASDPGASFRCQVDQRRPVPCASPFRPPKLRPGKHKLRVQAVDAFGNVDPTPAVKKFRILPPK
jgi:hypothetical protein